MVHTESAGYYTPSQALKESPHPTALQKPTTDRYRQFTYFDLRVVKNGIDVQRHKLPEKSTIYEDKCFEKIVDESDDKVILGPHIIDIVFATAFHGRYRPDAIEFDKSDPDSWQLKKLYEFKSGKFSNTTRKLEGFSVLAKDFRQNEHYLPAHLRNALPSEIPIAGRFTTPDDPEINVVFVSPSGEKGKNVETEFNLTYKCVPAA